MAKEFVTLCSTKNKSHSKASSNEPRTQAASSATTGTVEKRMSNNSGGNMQQKINKQHGNTSQYKNNGAGSYSATTPSAADMKVSE